MVTLKEIEDIVWKVVNNSKPKEYSEKDLDDLFGIAKKSTLTIITQDIAEVAKKFQDTDFLPKESELIALKISINKYFKIISKLKWFSRWKTVNYLSTCFRNLFIISAILSAAVIILKSIYFSIDLVNWFVPTWALQLSFVICVVLSIFSHILFEFSAFFRNDCYFFIRNQNRLNQFKQDINPNKLTDKIVEVSSITNEIYE